MTARRHRASALLGAIVGALACGPDDVGGGAGGSAAGTQAESTLSGTSDGPGVSETGAGDGSDAGSTTAPVSGSSSDDVAADETDTSSCPDVHVGDLVVDETTDLDALRLTRRIEGALTIKNLEVTDLEFLCCLRVVEGTLRITRNDMLTGLEGLEGVTDIGVRLAIAGNISLTSLASLERLTALDNLDISANSSLPSIDLPAIEQIGVIKVGACDSKYSPGIDNPELQSLDGLSGLTSVESVRIGSQSALTSIARLQELAAAGGLSSAEFSYNTSLPYEDILLLADTLGSEHVSNTCGNLGEPESHECFCDNPG